MSYERLTCRSCGGHWSKTRDKSVARDVQDVENVCLDCEAIEQVRNARHGPHASHPELCDCDKRVVYVAQYVPLPGN